MPLGKLIGQALLFTFFCFTLESVIVATPMSPGLLFYPASLLFWIVMNAFVAAAALLLARIAQAVTGRRSEPSYIPFVLAGFCFFAGGAIFLTKHIPGRIHSPANLAAMAAMASLAMMVGLVFYTRTKASAPSASRLASSSAPFLLAAWALLGLRFLFPKLELLPWTVAVPAFLVYMAVCPVVLIVGLTQRRAVPGIGLAAAALGLAGASFFGYGLFGRFVHQTPGRPGTDKPDIVLLIVDTARADALTAPGGDGAAREWASFQRFYAISHWTVPTHGSLFTGMLPSRHGSDYLAGTEDLISPLQGEAETLASILARQGYETRAFLANTYLSRHFGLQAGFSDYRVYLAPSYHSLMMAVHEKLYPFIDKDRRLDRILDMRTQADTGEVARSMRRALRGKKGRPKLLVANLMETHGMTKHPGESGAKSARIQPAFGRDAAGAPQVDERLGAAIREWYYEEARMVNEALAEFVGDLKKTERWDNCLFIITSDHGELLGEHGDYGHTNWLYEEIVRIPLYIKYPKYPGARKAGEDGRYLSQVDLFAEILRVAGVPAPEGIQGRPFEEASHPIVMEGKAFPSLARRWPGRYLVDQTAVISRKKPGFKLILYSNGKKELFDLNQDPKELAPLEDGALAAEIESELRDYYASLPKPKAAGKPIYYDSLGYIK